MRSLWRRARVGPELHGRFGGTGSEMSLVERATETGNVRPKGRELRLYWALLSVQLAGVVILLVNMVPLYRLMVLDFTNYRPDSRPWWAAAGMLLIQTAYWLHVRLHPPLPQTRSVLLGHIVAFVARLGFVAVTSAFSVMFLNRFEALRDLNYPPLRALVVLMIFFSLFCWTLELERLAKALQESNHEGAEAHHG